MHRLREARGGIAALATAVAALAAFAPQTLAGAPSPDPAAGQVVETMFGLRAGDERRYTLEPSDHLAPGEIESYVMRLVSIYDHPQHGRVARLQLEHVRVRFVGGNIGSDAAHRVVEQTDVLVNENGFPVVLAFRLQNSGLQPTTHAVSLVYDDGQYVVSNEDSMYRREYRLPVPTPGHFDREALAGIFLSSDINPGLLTLPYAVMADGVEDFRYTAFDPRMLARRDYRPGRRYGSDGTAGPVNAADEDRRPRVPRSTDMHPQFDARTFDFEDVGEIAIGPATWTAHRVRLGGRYDRWLADDGTVLRFDTRDKWGDAWFRLLRPSEY